MALDEKKKETEKELDEVNKDIAEKPLPEGDLKGIDPFLLRIDKLDKLELAEVVEDEEEDSPTKME